MLIIKVILHYPIKRDKIELPFYFLRMENNK